jgi:hypothetical protein
LKKRGATRPSQKSRTGDVGCTPLNTVCIGMKVGCLKCCTGRTAVCRAFLGNPRGRPSLFGLPRPRTARRQIPSLAALPGAEFSGPAAAGISVAGARAQSYTCSPCRLAQRFPSVGKRVQHAALRCVSIGWKRAQHAAFLCFSIGWKRAQHAAVRCFSTAWNRASHNAWLCFSIGRKRAQCVVWRCFSIGSQRAKQFALRRFSIAWKREQHAAFLCFSIGWKRAQHAAVRCFSIGWKRASCGAWLYFSIASKRSRCVAWRCCPSDGKSTVCCLAVFSIG